jgi:hypothetical protein
MAQSFIRYTSIALAALATTALGSGCSGRRMLVVTGTSIGLHVTPGDGETSPPQATLGYKRSEVAIVPTGSKDALNDADASKRTDAFSALAAFRFYSRWVERTTVESVIATGHAARCILDEHDLDPACAPKPPAPPDANAGASVKTATGKTVKKGSAVKTEPAGQSKTDGAGKFADAIQHVVAERDWKSASGCLCGMLCPDKEPCQPAKQEVTDKTVVQ